ncbi:MAG: START domain-containing protein [Spirochaetes bacterium]|nr:START domain-containing protein [Spirochaetota bacterium]
MKRTGRDCVQRIAGAAGIVAALVVFASPPAARGDEPWRQVRDTDGIRVYLRGTARSGIGECKAVTTLQGVTLTALLAVMDDVPAYPQWMNGSYDTRELQRVSLYERVIYAAQRFPFGLQDRDMVTRSLVRQDPATKTIFIRFEGTPGFMPPVPGRLRVPEVKGHWEFRPLGGGAVEVEYQFYMNPGGRIFAWMVNMGLPEAPMKTLRGLKRAVTADRYRNARIPQVTEP